MPPQGITHLAHFIALRLRLSAVVVPQRAVLVKGTWTPNNPPLCSLASPPTRATGEEFGEKMSLAV
eukprot:5964768-Pyramimonas_sp.AAC.1